MACKTWNPLCYAMLGPGQDRASRAVSFGGGTQRDAVTSRAEPQSRGPAGPSLSTLHPFHPSPFTLYSAPRARHAKLFASRPPRAKD
eukprot:1745821-Rhodomonas_salina.1